jgi:hypothetical protein
MAIETNFARRLARTRLYESPIETVCGSGKWLLSPDVFASLV